MTPGPVWAIRDLVSKTKQRNNNNNNKKAKYQGCLETAPQTVKVWDVLSLHALLVLDATYQHSIFSCAKVLAQFQPALYRMNK